MTPSSATVARRRAALASWALVALAALAGAAGGSRAAIFACPAGDGTTVFQDRPCERVAPAAHESPTRRSTTPAGLHPSWFERPARASQRAWCDERGCECGAHERRFDGELALAVSDALYLDGSWHRYERSVVAFEEVSPDEGAALELRRRQVEEAACEVQMAQRTLRAHAERVLGSLRARARAAEERGFDDPAACDGGDPEACDYLDAVELYRRVLGDLATLRRARDGTDVTDPLSVEARSSP